jgi:hypothetical protein
MRKLLLLSFGVLTLATLPALHAAAQQQDDEDRRRQAEADAAKAKKEKDKAWDTTPADLPKVKNAGPCPFVKVLYDAGRYQEFKDGRESANAVGFSGEIQDISASCQYKGADPIKLQLQVQFELGRGPQAQGREKEYRYWVAVTTRNKAVLARQDFTVKGDFPEGQDRMFVIDKLDGITIPRADQTVSGENFEILVGFDVTTQMAEFNRLGKRFRVNAAPTALAAAAGTPAAK